MAELRLYYTPGECPEIGRCIWVRFTFDNDFLQKFKIALRTHARQHLFGENTYVKGSWVPELRLWCVHPIIWPFVLEDLRPLVMDIYSCSSIQELQDVYRKVEYAKRKGSINTPPRQKTDMESSSLTKKAAPQPTYPHADGLQEDLPIRVFLDPEEL